MTDDQIKGQAERYAIATCNIYRNTWPWKREKEIARFLNGFAHVVLEGVERGKSDLQSLYLKLNSAQLEASERRKIINAQEAELLELYRKVDTLEKSIEHQDNVQKKMLNQRAEIHALAEKNESQRVTIKNLRDELAIAYCKEPETAAE